MIEIVSQSGVVLYGADVSDVREAAMKAVSDGADLRGAALYGADLYGADLYGADLRGAALYCANLYGANLYDADLRGANLRGADLRGADLRDADLRDADLCDADLDSANLRGANLEGAILRGADLCDADLRDADLDEADLRDADLRGAALDGANFADGTLLPTWETWGEYLATVVPALCTAGGKALEEVAAAWECHEWENCPMHVAFGANSPAECPPLLRPRVEQFVQLFDAGLVPCPVATTRAV